MSGGRTVAVGDIHGDLAALETLLARLPALVAGDTVVFLGDYVDRGPDSRGVVERVRAIQGASAARVVTLRGNHEDMWVRSWQEPELGFLFPPGNGCAAMYRSFVGGPPVGDDGLTRDEFSSMIDVRSWLPADVHAWMAALPYWYEDEHAIYVHAGLEGEGMVWKHASESSPMSLLWMREPDFFANYAGKRVVFGHTPVADLPRDHLGPLSLKLDDPGDVWRRGDLIGLDTGAGKGGFLSALELPSGDLYESRTR